MKTPFQNYSQFYKPPETDQAPNQIVDISTWSVGGDFNPYAEGTRAKFEVTCPASAKAVPFLQPMHRYLYKKTFERKGRDGGPPNIYYDQFWVEIAAYHVGRALNIEVPPAFVAARSINEGTEVEHAALIEWYYNYPEHDDCRVERGGNLMSRLIEGYDRDKGRQHNFTTIREFFSATNVKDWQKEWVKMLTFDAIIGNTDRHQENWELLHYPCSGNIAFAMSPAFDNGTAMGYDVLGKDIQKYIEKGTHHMKWHQDDAKQMGHFALLIKLIETLPNAGKTIAEVVSHDLEKAYNTIRSFPQYELQNTQYALSDARVAWMIALIKARIERIKQLLVT